MVLARQSGSTTGRSGPGLASAYVFVSPNLPSGFSTSIHCPYAAAVAEAQAAPAAAAKARIEDFILMEKGA